MTTQSTDRSYTLQLQRIAQSLAVAHNDLVACDVRSGQSVHLVAMFTEGNLDKRFDKLRDQVELLDDEFPQLDDLISEYVAVIPLAAYDTGSSDGDRFAQWVTRRMSVSEEQRDLLAVIRSRHAVEEIARCNRLAHVRFQERLSLNDMLLPELPTSRRLRLYLNPIRLVTHFRSDLFVAVDSTADAVFFAVGTEIRVAVLDENGHRVLRVLSETDGLLVSELSMAVRSETESAATGDELTEIVCACAELGLIAIG
ncbi:MAG: hypothetical protein ACYTGL_02030 [Planctomycetota bacterium]|jgi:hypothetical protein